MTACAAQATRQSLLLSSALDAQVDQAALTGESLPVKKFPGHIAFSGSTIKQGEQEALVYATGKNTFFGRAASLIAGTNSVANIQKVGLRNSASLV